MLIPSRTLIEGFQTASKKDLRKETEKRKQSYIRRIQSGSGSGARWAAGDVAGRSCGAGTERQTGRAHPLLPRDCLTEPRSPDRRQEEPFHSWMVDRQTQHERVFLKRMGVRRAEINRSFDEGLAFESPRSSYHSSRSAGSKNRSSGIFSLFKWFKKEKSEEESDLDVGSGPSSPVLPRAVSITGSVDTLFSTATVNSFAFVNPQQYRPFGSADPPEIRIQVGPETSTYRNRIRDRDRLRGLEKNISLREKYRLYASGTLPRSVDHIHELTDIRLNGFDNFFYAQSFSKNSTLGRKKRKAPSPPKESVPIVRSESEEIIEKKGSRSGEVKQHRRTISEPVKVCHVKGKRKAPPPPGGVDPDVVSISTSNSNSSRYSRKKRKAPSPPRNKGNASDSSITNIIRQATSDILNDEVTASGTESLKEETASTASTLDICTADVVCTDTLKLERGILKPKMERAYAEPKICPTSPVSPRPWYKRAASKDGSVREKDKRKERDRRKVEDWMIESGIPRRSLSSNDTKYNIFTRPDKTEDKRKSQISILTNISELDREAAEIIRRGKEREKTLIDSHNAMFYNDKNLEASNSERVTENQANPSKNSARELISLFNAITNVTKVTLNSSIFPRDESNLLAKEKKKNIGHKYEQNFRNTNNEHPIEIESFDEIIHRNYKEKTDTAVDEEKPGTSSASSANSSGIIARVTIEELDEYDAERGSKSQLLYEANKRNRNITLPIPTITEGPEGSAKSSPTTALPVETTDAVPNVKTGTQIIEVKQMNVWICPRCTLENLRWRITCEACDMWRPNPFELREKVNTTAVTANEIKNNLLKKDSSKSSSLYPNLSSLNTDSEIAPKPLSNPANTPPDIIKAEPISVVIPKEKQSNSLSSAALNENKCTENSRDSNQVDTTEKIPNGLGNKINNENELKSVQSTKNINSKVDVVLKKTIPEVKNNNPITLTTVSEAKIQDVDIKHMETDLGKNKTEVGNKKEENKQMLTPQITSNDINDEVRKARIAFFNKPLALQNKEGTVNKADSQDVEKQKINQEESSEVNKSGNIDKGEEKRIMPSSKHSEKSSKPFQSNVVVQESNSAKQHHNMNNTAEVQTKIESKPVCIAIDADIEKKKLKEMLIEMKHSLPKRPKPIKKVEIENTPPKTILEAAKTEVISVLENNLNKQTSSQRKIESAMLPSATKPAIHPNPDLAEAYLIESETIIEEIKIKKPSEKVSSSVQTSGLVTQISPKIKQSSGKEILIPIKVEEHTIKDGIHHTSVSKDLKKIGIGTFELMRPRDFANIKGIKTESKPVPLPLYENILDDDSNSSVKSEEDSVNASEYIDKLSKQLVKPEGVANLRARLDVSNYNNANTLAVNRLLKRLEGAIANGNHDLAAEIARELAQLKVICSVIRQKEESPSNEIQLDLYVEDKTSHQGPFHIKVTPTKTVKDLKELVERQYEIPTGVQRWIIANQLAGDETATLESLGVNNDGFPVFLYLVAPDPHSVKIEEVIEIEDKPSTSGVTSATSQAKAVEVEEPVENFPPKEDIVQAGPSRVTTVITEKSSTPAILPDNNPMGTLALGWKCEACTLMNSPTRPGCAACSTGRPDVYKIPKEYQPNEAEALRIQKELNDENQSAKEKALDEEEKALNYQKLVDLEKDDLIIYPEEFECPVCLAEYEKMEGIVLRECLHVFCRTCLANTIQFSDEAEVKCPYRDNNYTCDSTLLEREIKSLVTPKAFEEHLAKSIALAETKIGNAFHCKTPDCVGWCIYEDNVNVFKCPVCTHTNCLTCQAVHEGLNCKQYQEQINNNSDMNIEVKRTKEMLQEMVDRGEAMNCPTCQVVLMKKWGCDWLRCSMCKTEICWITRGPRWGPNGKGDTSGGCQCGVNGIKCHPKCTYCH